MTYSTVAKQSLPEGLETNIPVWHGEDPWLYMQRHQLAPMTATHWHSHIEINYLSDCSLTYASGGRAVRVPPRRIVVFWAAVPHQVTEVEDIGLITCVYVPLQEFTRWNLPVRYSHEVLHGGFLLSEEESHFDQLCFDRWLQDSQNEDLSYCRQALDEIELRLRRMALAGWRSATSDDAPVRSTTGHLARGIIHVEAMANFIAEHYASTISVSDVAEHIGLHPNYAMTLFKRVVGLSISAYLTRHRLSHAQAMLLNTDKKILTIAMDCGFGSLSRFYEAFRSAIGTTPRQYRDEWRRR